MSINNEFKVLEDTIEILGSKEEEGKIEEADVQFKTLNGNKWYITLETADNHFLNLLSEINRDLYSLEDMGIEDSHIKEPKKLIWNDFLNADRIHEILVNIPFDLLKNYVIRTED